MSRRQKDLFPELPNGKKYVSDIPELVAEWHPTKNKGVLPEDCPHKSGLDVWWICSKGHEWAAKVSNRVNRGSGCPYCANKRPNRQYNLLIAYPEVAAEWDYVSNKNPPDRYLPVSGAKVHWRCVRGHKYTATISNRTKQRSGCPKCTKQSSGNEIRILSELETLFPDVRSRHKIGGKEVDIFIRSIDLAIEYDGSYWHRDKFRQDKAKSDFLKMQGLKIIRVRENPLKRIDSTDIILENSGPISKENMNIIVGQICNAETVKEYAANTNFFNEIKYRTYLDYFPSPFPQDSLATLRPDIASEWDYVANAPLTPSNFSISASYKAGWICSKGHKWNSRIATRTGKKNHGCGFCSGLHATAEHNIATKHPHLLAYWDYKKNGELKPEKVTPNSGRKIWWKCSGSDDHSWSAVPYSMIKKKVDKICPFCSGRKVSSTNCLAITHPHFIQIWHPTKNGSLTPWMVTAGSDKKVWFVCSAQSGHEYQGVIHNMTKPFRRKFCPQCKFQ